MLFSELLLLFCFVWAEEEALLSVFITSHALLLTSVTSGRFFFPMEVLDYNVHSVL